MVKKILITIVVLILIVVIGFICKDISISEVASGKEKLLVGNYIINGMSLEVVNIKTILTHEQYERISYRLGDN